MAAIFRETKEVLQHNPVLQEKMTRSRTRSEMRRTMMDLRRSYEVGCRHIWRLDADVVAHRAMLGRLRRRELRLSRTLSAELETLLGPEP